MNNSVCMLPVGTNTYLRKVSELSQRNMKKRALITLRKDSYNNLRSHLKTLRNLLLSSPPSHKH